MKMNQQRVTVQRQLAGQQAMALLEELNEKRLAPTDRLVLDVSQVSQIDASGVAVLVRLYSQLRRMGVALQVENASEAVVAELRRVALTAVVSVSPVLKPLARPSTRPAHA